MTYRELIVKLMKQHSSVLDQNIVVFNEEDERFYGITGHDVAENIDGEHEEDICCQHDDLAIELYNKVAKRMGLPTVAM